MWAGMSRGFSFVKEEHCVHLMLNKIINHLMELRERTNKIEKVNLIQEIVVHFPLYLYSNYKEKIIFFTI